MNLAVIFFPSIRLRFLSELRALGWHIPISMSLPDPTLRGMTAFLRQNDTGNFSIAGTVGEGLISYGIPYFFEKPWSICSTVMAPSLISKSKTVVPMFNACS